MSEKLNNRPLTDIAAHRIAIWLIRMGATQKRWFLRLLLTLAPELLGLAMCLEEIYRPSNSLLWILESEDDNDDDNDFNGVLAEVNEMIERVSTPVGNDNFIIVIERRASLPADGNCLSFERVDATLHQRTIVQDFVLRGNRWKDWKHGNSKQELLELIARAIPIKETPVTLIRAAVMGHSMARLIARLSEK